MTVLGGSDGGMGKVGVSERQVREALVSLPLVLDRLATSLEHIDHNTNPQALGHIPAIADKPDGTWGVWCAACSARNQAYVYPCEEGKWLAPMPPAILVRVPASGE